MSRTQIPIPKEEADELRRLLNNGEPVPSTNLDTLTIGYGPDKGQYVKLDQLIEWLTQLSEIAVSDQKQDAYRGIRKALHLFQ